MSTASQLRAFHDTYDAELDGPFEGDEDTVLAAIELAEEDWDEEVLAEAFAEAGVEGSESWPESFWTELSTALADA